MTRTNGARPRPAARVMPRADVERVAAELAAEVVDYTRQAQAADTEKDRWIALARARDLSQILQGLTGYVAMFERNP